MTSGKGMGLIHNSSVVALRKLSRPFSFLPQAQHDDFISIKDHLLTADMKPLFFEYSDGSLDVAKRFDPSLDNRKSFSDWNP
jgi:hypothetical protein